VTAQDPEHPDYGSIRLVLSGPPVQLRQWIIIGPDGSQTTVVLGDMTTGARMASILFSIPQEIANQ